MFYACPAPMGITDPQNGTIIDMNEAFEDWSGYVRDEFIGYTTLEIGIWENEEDRLSFVDKMLCEGRIESVEIGARNKKGELRDVVVFARHIDIGDRSVIVAHFLDVTLQRQMEREIKEHRDHLGELVKERTSKLMKTIDLLGREIRERKKSEAALKSREAELEEMNSALKVLLKQRNEDKADMERNVLATIKTAVLPYIEKIKAATLTESNRNLLREIESRLEKLTSPFVRELSSEYLGLSPNEIRVASLIKEGKTSKEIAELLTISAYTVMAHRRSIRKKTALKGHRINLRAYLQTLE